MDFYGTGPVRRHLHRRDDGRRLYQLTETAMERSDSHLPFTSARARADSGCTADAPAPRRLRGWPRRWHVSVIALLSLLIIVVMGGVAAAQKKDSCVACHSQMEG